MKPLTIYKASAGSGKTFTLAVEYIKLLMTEPTGFRNILAVTFTNKATEEMKLRILSQLYGIREQLPESETYIGAVCDSLGISRQQAVQRAGEALHALIHSYHYFRVETIDKFFQAVLRNLARELDLTPNLKIGLNDYQVEEQAVDMLIDSLSSGSEMLKWLIDYIFSNINENKKWNVIGDVKGFGKNIFRDFYKSVSDRLNDAVTRQDFFADYTRKLCAIREDAKKRMAAYAKTFEDETAAAGLTPYSYARKQNGICTYFNRLKNGTFSDADCKKKTLADCLESAEKWASKTSPDREVIIALATDKLMPLLNDAERERSMMWRLCATADATLRHLNKVRLLKGIETTVRQLNADANRFLLSDTQHLLHSLISDSDSPFIFEKVGCRLEHIMIDEFQDTGTVQWQNFKVLLKECMSHSGDRVHPQEEARQPVNNLIVGDVKQSIYRWRDGDWRLLNGITGEFPSPESSLDIRSLQTNYRSERNVIDFNNRFFTTAARIEYEQELEISGDERASELMAAYADVCQKPRPGKDSCGLVRLAMLPLEDYDNAVLQRIGATVGELLAAGAAPSDIAVIVRYNRHIPMIADYLADEYPDLRIVSDEAFRLDASLAVNTIMQAITLLAHPTDTLVKAGLAVTYQQRVMGRDITQSDILTAAAGNPEALDSLLPETFVKSMNRLIRMPLTDAIELIYLCFGLGRLDGQSAYVCAFCDKVADFVSTTPGNIKKFIEAWESDICGTTIQSDEADGLRLISIHKSKGLEYDHVIVPFCDWTLEETNSLLWCKPAVAPFSDLPLVPVNYSSALLETIYADDYRNEHIQNKVDNLNLLYVAFTRAARNLFVIGKRKARRSGAGCRSDIMISSLPELHDTLPDSTLSGMEDDGESPIEFSYGSLSIAPRRTGEQASENVFLQTSTPLTVGIAPPGLKVEFKQSNQSRDFVSGEDDSRRSRYIKAGNVLHRLFSQIRTADEADAVLKQLEFDGVLYDDELTAPMLRRMLAERLADERVSRWFSSRWRVFNECSILQYDEAAGRLIERRPDRVITDGNETQVIDFKFGKPRDEHRRQVAEYVSLLERMGHRGVKGFLWYVHSNEIVEV